MGKRGRLLESPQRECKGLVNIELRHSVPLPWNHYFISSCAQLQGHNLVLSAQGVNPGFLSCPPNTCAKGGALAEWLGSEAVAVCNSLRTLPCSLCAPRDSLLMTRPSRLWLYCLSIPCFLSSVISPLPSVPLTQMGSVPRPATDMEGPGPAKAPWQIGDSLKGCHTHCVLEASSLYLHPQHVGLFLWDNGGDGDKDRLHQPFPLWRGREPVTVDTVGLSFLLGGSTPSLRPGISYHPPASSPLQVT